MATFCFVLLESVKVGCRVELHVRGATLNQTYAHQWQNSEPEFETFREARQVPFIEP